MSLHLISRRSGEPSRRAVRQALLLSVSLMFTLPNAAIASPDAVEDTDYWRVVEISGEAQMLAGANSWNQQRSLAQGDVVGPYQAISTTAGSTVILIRGEDIIVVHEGTTISLPAPAIAHSETQIEQPDGAAFYAVDPRPDPQFAVQTQHLVAGVKGTEFSLIEDGTRLQVLHGVVGTRDLASGDNADVTAGQGTRGTGPGTNGFTTAMLSESELATLRAQSAMIESNRDAWQSRAGAQLDAEGEASVQSLMNADGAIGGQSGSAAEDGSAATPAGNALAGLETDLGAISGTLGESLGAVGGALGDSLGGNLGNTVDSVTGGLGGAVGGIGSGLGGAVGGLGNSLSGGSGGSSSSSSGSASSGSSSSGGSSSGSSGSGSAGGSESDSGGSGAGGSDSGSSGSSGSSSGGSGSGGGLGGVGDAVGGAVGGLL